MDRELFDYRREVEPILQVLVGRTLEQSRIELVEDYERTQENLHRVIFLSVSSEVLDGI